jgi:hypothetical protein
MPLSTIRARTPSSSQRWSSRAMSGVLRRPIALAVELGQRRRPGEPALLLGEGCRALDVRAPVRVHDLAVPPLVTAERILEGRRRVPVRRRVLPLAPPVEVRVDELRERRGVRHASLLSLVRDGRRLRLCGGQRMCELGQADPPVLGPQTLFAPDLAAPAVRAVRSNKFPLSDWEKRLGRNATNVNRRGYAARMCRSGRLR